MRKRREIGQSSDIAFLLIIFFLLLAGIATTHSISIELPEDNTAHIIDNASQTLKLLKDGSTILDEQVISRTALPTHLNANTHLLIEIEEETIWQEVVSLLALIEQLGVESLNLELLP